jgi:hypothetical protein
MRRQNLNGVDRHQFSMPGASAAAALAVGLPGFSIIERIAKTRCGDMVPFAIDEIDDRGVAFQLAKPADSNRRSRRSRHGRVSLRARAIVPGEPRANWRGAGVIVKVTRRPAPQQQGESKCELNFSSRAGA